MSVLSCEWNVLVRVCDVVRLTVTELSEYMYVCMCVCVYVCVCVCMCVYVCVCVCMYVCMYVCKVFCPEAGPSLDMHYQGSIYLNLLDERKE